MNVAEMILSQGSESAPALLHRGTVVTYGELREAVGRVARDLLARGCRRGDRIGIFSENSPFFVAAYLGVIRAGLVAVPFQTELAESTFAKIVGDAGTRQVFVSKKFAKRVRQWAEKEGLTLSVEREDALTEGNEENKGATPEPRKETNHTNEGEPGLNCKAADPRTADNQLAALMFTSGSTGEPKGVMISHRNIECNTRDIISYMGLTAADRVMVVLPFHYCFGLSLLHTHLMAGGSLVLNNDFRLYPETVLREMVEKECTGLAGVPSTYQILLRKSRFREMSFPKLRWFQQAGGKLPNPCIREIRDSFPRVCYYLMYGQTEATARLSYLPPERLGDKLGSIGKGLPSTRLEVLKSDDTPVRRCANASAAGMPVAAGGPLSQLSTLTSQPADDGEVGEIVASGDNIALGYWNDPAETARYFKAGKLHTGDLARVDEDGFIFIVERERDMIKAGGNRISAKEVEDVIAEIPELVEVAVVGRPHELLGESVWAFVVRHPAAATSADEVLMHCRKRLPAFKTPEKVVFLGSMPHNSAGKIMKHQLSEYPAAEDANRSVMRS